MSEQVTGDAANVSAPPAALNISSSTNATPIEVTTSVNHLLGTGDQVLIADHLVDTNANGFRIAHVTAPNKFTLFDLTGAPVAGNGVGVATGTVQSMALGATYPIPDDNDDFVAASVNVAFEAIADKLAFLWAASGWKQTVYKGGTVELRAGAKLLGDADSLIYQTGRGVHRRPRLAVATGNHTIKVSDGDFFRLAPGGSGIITLSNVGVTGSFPATFSAERMEFIWNPTAAPPGVQWTFKDDAATIIATFVSSAVTAVNPCFAAFEWDGATFRLAENSASAYDGVADYGVVPGAGA